MYKYCKKDIDHCSFMLVNALTHYIIDVLCTVSEPK